MNSNDVQLLQHMRDMIVAYSQGDITLGTLANDLVILRDNLQFEDRLWFRELTEHLVTLDSASTFCPAGQVQSVQLATAVTDATEAVQRLVEDKIPT